jgi:hypothetical protein
MVELERNEGNFVALKLSGKLHDADYQAFVPVIQAATQKGKLHLLVEFVDFHGWDAQALWDDMKLEGQIANKIERMALVGDKRWQEFLAKFCRPFTSAEIQYFDAQDSKDAWAWVQDGL